MELKHLGQQTALPKTPDEAILECVPNPHPDTNYAARFTIPEFTSLCPVTGQPDFACFIIDYVPDKLLVESKALKLFMGSFRNHGAFHEACSVTIGKRFYDAALPKYIRVAGFWYPRGGISIDVLWEGGLRPSIELPSLPRNLREAQGA